MCLSLKDDPEMMMDTLARVTRMLWDLEVKAARYAVIHNGDRGYWRCDGLGVSGNDTYWAALNILHASSSLAADPWFGWEEDYNRRVLGLALRVMCSELGSKLDALPMATVAWTAYHCKLWSLHDFVSK